VAVAETPAPPAGVIVDYPPPRNTDRQPGPNDRQQIAHRTEVDELLYGGAAGGGKTDYLIAEVLAVLLEFPGANGVLFRRTHPQLSELGGIEQRLLDRLPTSIGTYNASKYIWTFRNGSRLRLAHCATDKDVTKYQGAEWAIAGFDQLEQFTEFQYRYLLHRLRVSGELARRMEAVGYVPKAISTANPGGVGHGWVKRRFIDPFPQGDGTVFRPAPDPVDDPNPGTRAFVMATVEDNPDVDPHYAAVLERLPEDERRAMRYGDWNVYAGQRFRDFRTAIHVIDPERLPIRPGAGVTRAVGVDYGLDAPFAALWGAKLSDGLVVIYRELYKAGLTPAQQARRILDAEEVGERRPGRPIPVALDPSTWARNPHHEPTAGAKIIGAPDDGRPPPGSIAAVYREAGLPVHKARNDRLAGVALVADKLRVRDDGLPRLLIYSTCRDLIRTLPELVRDDRRPEDVDTTGEDHAYDALRYLLMELEGRPAASAGNRPPPGQPERVVETIRSEAGDLLAREL
jgi:hypothetical protein